MSLRSLVLGSKMHRVLMSVPLIVFIRHLTKQDDIKVFVDEMSLGYLTGSEVDYVESLMGAGFAVNNPNAVSTCGCGHSFKTADGEGEARGCSH